MISSKSFIQQYLKRLSPRIVSVLLLFLAAIFLFGVIIHEVLLEQETAVDYSIFSFLAAHFVQPDVTPFMSGISVFASAHFLQIAYPLVALLYLVRKDWKRAIEIGVIGLGGFLLNYFMKHFFERPRPENPLVAPLSNFSFPSGHAMSGFIFYGLLAYLIFKTKWPRGVKYALSVLLIFFSLLIGFSRVYLRLHYASDVVGGFCMGFAWLLAAIAIMEQQKKQSDKSISHETGKPTEEK